MPFFFHKYSLPRAGFHRMIGQKNFPAAFFNRYEIRRTYQRLKAWEF